jgi:hypothetical protein
MEKWKIFKRKPDFFMKAWGCEIEGVVGEFKQNYIAQSGFRLIQTVASGDF